MKILEDGSIKKWSVVSRKMQEEYNIAGRTGKQCRERWHNQLNPDINNNPWTEQEEELLFHNHDMYGNKWSRIAQDLPRRTDNAIKNHFYSTLRKAVRRLNRFVGETKHKGEMREIKPLVLSKIVVLSGDKSPPKTPQIAENIQKSVDIKHRLIAFAKHCDDEKVDTELMRKLLIDIANFNNQYKRRTYPVKRKNEESEVMPKESSVKDEFTEKQPLTKAKQFDKSELSKPKLQETPVQASSAGQFAQTVPVVAVLPAAPVVSLPSSSAFSFVEKPKKKDQQPTLVIDPIPAQPNNYNRFLSSSLEAFMNGRSNTEGQYRKLNESELNLPYLQQLVSPPTHSYLDNAFTFSSVSRPNAGDWTAELEKLQGTFK